MTMVTAPLGGSLGAKCRVTSMATAGKCLAVDLHRGIQIITHPVVEVQVTVLMGEVQVSVQTNHIKAASNPALKRDSAT
jgi:hypothetical protein